MACLVVEYIKISLWQCSNRCLVVIKMLFCSSFMTKIIQSLKLAALLAFLLPRYTVESMLIVAADTNWRPKKSVCHCV